MKNNIFLVFSLLGLATSAHTQNINWQAFQPQQKHVVHLSAGWDYGLGLGFGYGYKFNTRWPVLANLEYSFPSGKNLFDDFKIRLGGQVEALRVGGFSATLKVYAPIRRFENTKARLFSFGGEFSGVAGFYRKKWFVAGEFGFDKAIATHVRHSAEAREDFPGAQDGWYVPTGGNFFYGLQTGVSFGANDISLRAGKLTSQGWKTAPFIPWLAQLNYQRRF